MTFPTPKVASPSSSPLESARSHSLPTDDTRSPFRTPTKAKMNHLQLGSSNTSKQEILELTRRFFSSFAKRRRRRVALVFALAIHSRTPDPHHVLPRKEARTNRPLAQVQSASDPPLPRRPRPLLFQRQGHGHVLRSTMHRVDQERVKIDLHERVPEPDQSPEAQGRGTARDLRRAEPRVVEA